MEVGETSFTFPNFFLFVIELENKFDIRVFIGLLQENVEKSVENQLRIREGGELRCYQRVISSKDEEEEKEKREERNLNVCSKMVFREERGRVTLHNKEYWAHPSNGWSILKGPE